MARYTIYEIVRCSGQRTGFITEVETKEEIQKVVEQCDLSKNYYNITGPRGTDTIHDIQMLLEYVLKR